MKRLFMFVFVVAMAWVMSGVALAEPVTGRKEYKDIQTYRAPAIFHDKLTVGNDAQMTQQPIVINNRNQLSNRAGDTGVAGLSTYQMESGKRYQIDLYALSRGLVNGVTGAFTGVTLYLPDALKNSGGTVKVELVVSGATGYPQWEGQATGVSQVWVAPYSGGTTSYAKGAVIPQTMQTYAIVNGTTGVTKVNNNMASGTSFWALDKPGESAEFGLSNSQVSAYPIQVTERW